MSEQPDILDELRGLLSRNYNSAIYIRDRAIAEIERLRAEVYHTAPGELEFGGEGWTWRQQARANEDRLRELEAEVASLRGVVAALEEHSFRMSLDRAGHFWACDKCPNVMWGEHFVRQCPKCKSEGPFAPSTVHRWVTANPERADELRAKHHVILAIARDCLIPPAKEPANG